MKRVVLSETRENHPLHWADSASLHSGIYRLIVGFSCCRLLALPEMAYRHPLLKLFYGGLQGRFPCFAPMRLPFASKIVKHSRYLPASFEYASINRSKQGLL
jgi:hypothetical protein